MKLKNIIDSHLCILSPNNLTPAIVLNSKLTLLRCHCTQQLLEDGGPCIAALTAAHTKLAALAKRQCTSQYCFGLRGALCLLGNLPGSYL